MGNRATQRAWSIGDGGAGGGVLYTLRNSDPQTPSQLHDRASDNWRPLIAIGELCSLGEDVQRAALAISGGMNGDLGEVGAQLLLAIKEIFDETGKGKIWSRDLVNELNQREGEMWADWRGGNGISQSQLAKQLRPFGIRTQDTWIDNTNRKGYSRESFDEVFVRYIHSSEPLDPLGSSNDAGSKHFDEPLGEGVPSGLEIGLKTSTDAGSSGPSASYTSMEEAQEPTPSGIDYKEMEETFMREVQGHEYEDEFHGE